MKNRGYAYREKIDTASEGRTALEYLSTAYDRATHAEWSARFGNGEVTLDAAPAATTDRLRSGQLLVWNRPPWDEPDVPRSWELLYEDDALLAVNKPSGLPTLPGGGFVDGTLLTLVREKYPEANPLHRLGRHTSGLLLFARTAAAAKTLSKAFREHDLEKQYLAVGSGVAKFDELAIKAPIGPVTHGLLGTVHAASEQGKSALSLAKVIERRTGETLFSVAISTGRPHQIRIHLAWAGHPLVGDPLYPIGGVPLPSCTALPGDGGYLLHAEWLAFDHPVTGARVELRAPPPTDTRHRYKVQR